MFEREYAVTMIVCVKVYATTPKEAEDLAVHTTANWHSWDVDDITRRIDVQETGL